jgi:predicted nucleic acid-binding protein
MKFWDSSAIVPLIVGEPETEYCLNLLSEDQEITIWCLTRVEVISALCRRLLDGTLDDEKFQAGKGRLDDIIDRAFEVRSLDRVRSRATRLLEVHPLRSADSLQLASALIATQEDPDRMPLVSFDRRLTTAATREGFVVHSG